MNKSANQYNHEVELDLIELFATVYKRKYMVLASALVCLLFSIVLWRQNENSKQVVETTIHTGTVGGLLVMQPKESLSLLNEVFVPIQFQASAHSLDSDSQKSKLPSLQLKTPSSSQIATFKFVSENTSQRMKEVIHKAVLDLQIYHNVKINNFKNELIELAETLEDQTYNENVPDSFYSLENNGELNVWIQKSLLSSRPTTLFGEPKIQYIQARSMYFYNFAGLLVGTMLGVCIALLIELFKAVKTRANHARLENISD